MRTLIEPSLGAPDREHEISAPGGAYSPVLCQPPILESISTVRLTVWAPFSGTPGKSFAAGHAFSEASLASFHSRHFSRSACMRPASFPFFHGEEPVGNSSIPSIFPPCPRTMFPAAYLFRLDFIPARNRINGKLRHPVFHGLGKTPFRFRLFLHRNIFLLPAGLFLTFAPFQLLPSPFSRSSRSACS